MNCPGNNFVTTFLRVDKKIIIICLPRDLSGFTPDKSRGPLAPRDLSGVKPTFQISKTIEFINSLNSSLDIHP